MTTQKCISDTKRTLSPSEQLNQECFCITLDRDALRGALEKKVAAPQLFLELIKTRAHIFSNAPVFLSKSSLSKMLQIARTIEAAASLPDFRKAVLSWAPEIARHDFGPLGALMGYDFHLAHDGPRLIEVNTNAGGAFLNSLLIEAQRSCCAEVEAALNRSESSDFESSIVSMFEHEWTLQGNAGTPGRIAIVDDRPEEQYLYPEFVLAQRMLQQRGIETVIVDASLLLYEQGRLMFNGQPIDLVYNRLVDFSLDLPGHEALRAAYCDGAVVVTPNPHIHAVFADKRNLTLLSDSAALRSWGLPSEMIACLAGIPRTVLVTPESAQTLWQNRKSLFFKPASGHGGKAVYRGDKLTKGVWAEILQATYVAQQFAAPGKRMVKVDGSSVARKADIRLYVYNGQNLLAAARLYQGQTTNFRTPGGGFAPVFAI
jgi:hypothetical protein